MQFGFKFLPVTRLWHGKVHNPHHQAHAVETGQWETFQSGFEEFCPSLCQWAGQIIWESSAVWLDFNLILDRFPRVVQYSQGLTVGTGMLMWERGRCASACLIHADSREPGRGEGAWMSMLLYITDWPPAIFEQLWTIWPAVSSLEIPYLRSWPLSSDDTSSMWIWSQSWEANEKKMYQSK